MPVKIGTDFFAVVYECSKCKHRAALRLPTYQCEALLDPSTCVLTLVVLRCMPCGVDMVQL